MGVWGQGLGTGPLVRGTGSEEAETLFAFGRSPKAPNFPTLKK